MENHNFVCTQCGHRQAADAACGGCPSDIVLDLRKRETRELLADIDLRITSKREDRLRMVAVILGIGLVVGLWMMPGYWDLLYRLYLSLPQGILDVLGAMFLPGRLDQIILMVAIAFGLLKLIERVPLKKKFPFLDALPPPINP